MLFTAFLTEPSLHTDLKIEILETFMITAANRGMEVTGCIEVTLVRSERTIEFDMPEGDWGARIETICFALRDLGYPDWEWLMSSARKAAIARTPLKQLRAIEFGVAE